MVNICLYYFKLLFFHGKKRGTCDIMNLEIDKRARGLIFDLDGTLADSMPAHFKAWKQAALEHGFIYTEELFYGLAGMPTHKIVPLVNEKLGLRLDPEEFSRRKEEIFLKHIKEVKTIKPVVELVYQNYGRLPMSVGTGGKKYIAELTIKILGLDRYIDIIVSADDVKNHKPFPDTFLKCSELMGVPPGFCQVFEDGDAGLLAGKRAGMIVTDIRAYI